jgi:FkbH-like protein
VTVAGADRSQVQTLLAELGPAAGYVDVQRVGRQLLNLGSEMPAPPSARSVRIALASSFTIEPLAAALAVECWREGVAPHIRIDGYGMYEAHFRSPASSLWEFEPEIVFLACELPALAPDFGRGEVATAVEQAQAHFAALVDAFKAHSSALLVVHDLATPAGFVFRLSDEGEAPHARVNAWLHETYRSDPQVRVLGFDRLTALHGKVRAENPKLRRLASMALSESFVPLLAAQYLTYVKAALGMTRKCLVVDLDDTLWGGVAGEDGVDGIRLATHGEGSEYYELQRAILELRERGVILAINSKNNEADALTVLRDHPHMVLREQHFACLRINWQDKVANLHEIADELNLGIDSFAFLDTNPVERAWVREALPEVLVIDVPSDPTGLAAALRRTTDFEALIVTDEDRARGRLYAGERARRCAERSAAGFENFLHELGMVLRIRPKSAGDLARVGQLTRRTNQFNMTTRRYSDAELEALVRSGRGVVYTLRYEDAFGDAGLVGVAIMQPQGQNWELDTLLMSCRVLGRTIERGFLAEVLRHARGEGAGRVRAAFRPTAKNTDAAGFYPEFGFTEAGRTEDATWWELDLRGAAPDTPEWFVVEWLTDVSAAGVSP